MSNDPVKLLTKLSYKNGRLVTDVEEEIALSFSVEPFKNVGERVREYIDSSVLMIPTRFFGIIASLETL
ncbi:7342_t:CDS:1, partial [Racocetra fulgida]